MNASVPISYFLGMGSQVAWSANLLAVDTEVVERLSAPAENELQNVVKLFQRKVVRYRNQPGDERADFQQCDPEGQAFSSHRSFGTDLAFVMATGWLLFKAEKAACGCCS